VIAALLLLAALQQGTAPQVVVGVDRDRLAVGDVLGLTIRVTSAREDPLRVDLASIRGFEVEARSERSEVATGSGRTTVIEFRLRANDPGEWRLGPVTVRQGASFTQSDAVTVTVEGGTPAPVIANIGTRLSRLLQRARPPSPLRQAGISVLVSDSIAVVGEQVDVVTIAWFDREVRQQLRRAPTVEAPRLEGVWSYPQPVPSGIAASRQVNGRWYDLFILHHIVFPLTPGNVPISPATLQYSVPRNFQFFSQEERYKAESARSRFVVRALPDQGRPPIFAGAVGRGLAVTQQVTPASGKQGESFTAAITVRGEGNVALWPQPDIRWPNGVRVYPESAEESVNAREGRLVGEKVFKFLLLADSAGTLAVPLVRYAYFDPVEGRYQLAEGAATALVVAPRGRRSASRAEPPPIRIDRRTPLALRVQRTLPGAVWVLILLLPVAGYGVQRWPRPRRAAPSAQALARRGDSLGASERRLEQALRQLTGTRFEGHPLGLAQLLRHAGVAPEQAEELARLWDQLRLARYSPAATGAPEALARQVEAALARAGLAAARSGPRWRTRTGLLSVALLLTAGASGQAQTAPERLYEAGAYSGAAAGFSRQLDVRPDSPALWFNLGAAAYRAGDDGEALAAWTQGARIAPRDGGIRRALLLLPPADTDASTWLWVAPLSPAELWLVGAVCWLVAWGGILWTRRFRGRWIVLLAGGALFLALGTGLAFWYHDPTAVVASNAVLRLSPHELAPAVGEVTKLGAVKLEAQRGPWWKVRAPGGRIGWIRESDLAPLRHPAAS
jgi:hypothetical protein